MYILVTELVKLNFCKTIFELQWRPVNVITLGQTKSDNKKRMIKLIGYIHLLVFSKWDAWNVITVSGW